MSVEIERKFLVLNNDYQQTAQRKTRIVQGYLNSSPERTVRIRIRGQQGYLTIKGKSSQDGTSRYEWEKEIDLSEAQQLIKLCEPGLIDKIRYEVSVGQHTFEVDEFFAENQDLVVAEVELSSADDAFEKPDWLGEEVTGDKRYYNSCLMKHPFNQWIN
ncbi:CYTH domain-containing protein [Pelagibaculum spongiae]|uniref:Adenylate cyclase n=1 Tax=Pelagibaculum spongiae TaxID=2080658 RepID=A0A2V1GRH8_9GAMM|nr:CYTH domain-containing protein [Pelagibaculum spongiae]PVZ66373.1 adenylate cyclase [Pelagibaculum spongiae]